MNVSLERLLFCSGPRRTAKARPVIGQQNSRRGDWIRSPLGGLLAVLYEMAVTLISQR